MQITQQMMTQQFLYNITNTNETMQNLENELSTGKVLNQPSDNPLAVSQDMSVRAQITQLNGYQNTINAGLSWMNNTSSAIQQISTILQSVQSDAIEGLNGTNQSSSGEQALSENVQQLTSQIEQILNTKQGSRYLFGGQATSTAPYNSSANALSQTSYPGQMNYQVSDSETIEVNVTAFEINNGGTTSSATPLLSTLNSLVQDLQTGSETNLQTDLANLQANMSNITNINADLGARIQQMTALQNQYNQYSTNLTQLKSNLEDANMAQVITQFNTTQNVYTAALKMGSEVLMPSLVDYLPNG